ncbi:MAG TPA: hypothetical protein VI749_08930 [Candidatus Omnitrophota bacterium]|nr:hypothetical protein [Candidatus Omnitrophota bacterium]
MLSEQAIKEFQEIYFKECGEALAFDEAAARAESFLRFFKAVVKPSCKGSHNDHPPTITQS